MIIECNISKYNLAKLPTTFRPTIIDTNKGNDPRANVHFGSKMDIVVITAKDKQLTKNDQDRIRYLVSGE